MRLQKSAGTADAKTPLICGADGTPWKGRTAQTVVNSVQLLTAKVFQSVLGLTKSLVDVPCTPSALRIIVYQIT
jgi:hypothetical protein